MHSDRVVTLIGQDRIDARVAALGEAITQDYEGLDLTVVGILRGSFLFMADLVREVRLPLQCDFLELSSYGDAMQSSGVVRINKDLSQPVSGRHCLIVEDIVDTGLTLRYMLENLSTRGPASLRVCTLLDKPEGRRTEVAVDYVGFRIPNAFVVGYGLDLAQGFRNLPYVGIYVPEGAPPPGPLPAVVEPPLVAGRPA